MPSVAPTWLCFSVSAERSYGSKKDFTQKTAKILSCLIIQFLQKLIKIIFILTSFNKIKEKNCAETIHKIILAPSKMKRINSV